jgi:hypothetical protein
VAADEEVVPQRQQHVDVTLLDQAPEKLREALLHLLRIEREQLLELVHDEDGLEVALPPLPNHREGDVGIVEAQELLHRVRVGGKHFDQGLGERAHRGPARGGDDGPPARGTRGDQPRTHERGLPRPRRTDESQKPSLTQLGPERFDLRLPAEEAPRVRFREGREAWIGTPRLERPGDRHPARLETGEHRLERRLHPPRRGEAVGGALAQAASHHRFKRRRDPVDLRLERRGLVPKDRRQHLGGRPPTEGLPPRHQLVQHRPQGEDVGPRVRGLALHLLGGHVPDRPQENIGRGPLRRRRALPVRLVRDESLMKLREAEVQHLHPPVARQEDVVGLEVAVDDPALVGGAKPPRDLERPGHGLAQRGDPRAQRLAKRLALEELEDEVGVSLVGADVEDGDDVGVGESSGGAGLGLEAAEPVGGGLSVGGDELDRHLASEAGVAGAVDLAHAPGAERLHDLVGTEPCPGSQRHRPLLPSASSGALFNTAGPVRPPRRKIQDKSKDGAARDGCRLCVRWPGRESTLTAPSGRGGRNGQGVRSGH